MKIVIGMGGGYDIVAAYMIATRLQRENAQCQVFHVGGFLNPRFFHMYESTSGEWAQEAEINYVIQAKKYRRELIDGEVCCNREVHFVDSLLAQHIDNPVYNFSTGNSDKIVDYLDRTYQEIIFCDVGGDILFLGEKDYTVKTPIIDAFSLRIAARLCNMTPGKAKVILLGVGFDGELPYINLKENIQCLYNVGAVSSSLKIQQEDINILQNIFPIIRAPGKGKTIQLLLDIWSGDISDYSVFRRRNIQMYKQWYNKMFVLDAKKVADLNPLCSCTSFQAMKEKAKQLGVSMEKYRWG